MDEGNEKTTGAENVYISKSEIAHRLDVTTRTIETWMKEHKVPFEKIGRTVRFHWGDVRAHISRQNHRATQDGASLPSEGIRARLQDIAASIRKKHRED
jgi:excisionase family DNA binding protein